MYLLGDEPLGGRNEIIKDVLLLELRARLVPGLAVLAAAAEVRLGIDAAHLHPCQPAHRKHRQERDIETAIAVKQRRREPSSLMPFLWAMNIGTRVPSLLW